MALLDRVKERTGSDLSDGELTSMIAAITAEIEEQFGTSGEFEVIVGDPLDEESRWMRTLALPRPLDPAEPVAVVEIDNGNSGHAVSELALEATDYRVLHGGRTLQRLTSGPNGQTYWAPMVRVTYTPLGEQAARDEVTIKLMQLDLSYRGGLKSERAGDYQFTLGADAVEEREKLLSSLASSRRMVMG